MPLVRFCLKKSLEFGQQKNLQLFGGSSTTWTAWSQGKWAKNNLRRPENWCFQRFLHTSCRAETFFLRSRLRDKVQLRSCWAQNSLKRTTWRFTRDDIKYFNFKSWHINKKNSEQLFNLKSFQHVEVWWVSRPTHLVHSRGGNPPWSDEWIPWHPPLRRKKATGGKKPMMRRPWSQKGRRRNFPTFSFWGARHYTVEFSKKAEVFILEEANCECWCFSWYSWLTKRERERERLLQCGHAILNSLLEGSRAGIQMFLSLVVLFDTWRETQYHINRLDFKQQNIRSLP